MEQYRRLDYTLSSNIQFTFSEKGHVSLSFEPESIPGWKWFYNGLCYDYVRTIVLKYLLY